MARSDESFAVRLEAGAELPAAVERAAEELGLEFCDIDGFGELEWIELATAGGSGTRRLDGPLNLLGLRGRLRRAGDVKLADYVCTASRDTGNGIELLGGALVGAGATFVELRFAPLKAAEVDAADADDGEAAEAAERPARRLPLAGKWADALAESKRQEQRARDRGWDWDADREELRPALGDLVNHRQFGRCKVVRLDDEHISLRKPDGRVVQLGLAILEFTAAGEDEGKPVYDVAVRKT
jgi:predicted DNA-binding protein with PD1-like motif